MLSFLGVSAIGGGIPMILHPEGSPMFLPLDMLRYSPFHSFLIPGIVLLVANGLLSLWVLWLVLRHHRRYGLWVAFQGWVLLGWLLVECWMLREVMWLHYLYGVVALVLVVCGFLLFRRSVRGPVAQG
jgi:hypothetical protein